jgi:hypothetical protein
MTLNSIFDEINVYDELGYKRYWLSEHYSYEFAWYSPEMLMPILAGLSSKIKIGWTGVLLNYHSPLLVANNMRLLSAIYDNRIDLGISRSSLSTIFQEVIKAENEDWENLVYKIVKLCNGNWTNQDGTDFLVPPHSTLPPSLWYLAVSNKSEDLVVSQKLNFALSLMHPGSNLSTNLDTIKRLNELWFNKYEYLPDTTLLISTHCTTDSRIKKILENRYSIEGFKNLYGDADYINENLYKLQKIFENKEFTLHNPYCDRNKRMASFTSIIQNFTK